MGRSRDPGWSPGSPALLSANRTTAPSRDPDAWPPDAARPSRSHHERRRPAPRLASDPSSRAAPAPRWTGAAPPH